MMVGIAFLIVFFSAAVMPGQSHSCCIDHWWGSFDRKGLSKCEKETDYIRGFFVNGHEGDVEVSHLEMARCCSGDVAFSNSPSQVVFADWATSFDRHYTWNECPPGFFLQGLYRGKGDGGLWLIDEGMCSKPVTHPHSYSDCTVLEVSFNDKGWNSCPTGYFLTGLYRGSCGYLQCLDKFQCCKMESGPAPLTSHDDVKTRVMDTTLTEISYLAQYLGYAYCAGCKAEYTGQDFKRDEDTWVADKARRCEGYQAHRRLSINYGDWSYELKNIKFSEAVITELTPEVISSGIIINNSSEPSTASIERTDEVVRSVTHTTTSQWKSSYNGGLNIGFSLSFLGIFSSTFGASFNFGYETSTSTTDSTGKEQKKTFTVNQRKTIAGHSAVRWKLSLFKTRTTVSYTATFIPRFSAELRGFMKRGDGYDDVKKTNYHRKYRGSEARPDFPYRFGNSSTPFYRALKQESEQASGPWLWKDMKAAHPYVQTYIDSLTNENRYEMTLTGNFEDIYGHDVEFYWDDVPITESRRRFKRSSAQHNKTVTLVKTVARAQDSDPPPMFPDPPEVLLDSGL